MPNGDFVVIKKKEYEYDHTSASDTEKRQGKFSYVNSYCIARPKLAIRLVNRKSAHSRMDVLKAIWTTNSATIKSKRVFKNKLTRIAV